MKVSAYEALMADPRLDRSMALSSNEIYSNHLPGIINYAALQVDRAERQLGGLAALFGSLENQGREFDLENLAGVSEILMSVQFELKKVYVALWDETTTTRNEPCERKVEDK